MPTNQGSPSPAERQSLCLGRRIIVKSFLHMKSCTTFAKAMVTIGSYIIAPRSHTHEAVEQHN